MTCYVYDIGQFCNEKVEEQKERIYKKHINKSAQEKIRLVAVSECLLEEVERYATDEYIKTMGMGDYPELYVPVCHDITDLP
jgi:hypothetical protein